MASALIPQFPTLTFPNHFTLVTGNYPKNHGIVSNHFFDSASNQTFSYSKPSAHEGKWWLSNPIWNHVQHFGIKSAVCFWPGSEAEIDGQRPNYYLPFNATMKGGEKVDWLLSQYTNAPEGEKPRFFALYLDNVDKVGHCDGPNSPKIRDALIEVNSILQYLFTRLKQLQIHHLTNFVIVSDHGMAAMNEDKQVFLDDLLDLSSLLFYNVGPVATITPKPQDVQRIYSLLLESSLSSSAFDVYLKENLPASYHYDQSDRISPIIVIAKVGWTISKRGYSFLKGNHAYPLPNEDMNAVFVTSGPSTRYKSGSFRNPEHRIRPPPQNIDVYNFLCYLMKIKPLPNDGSTFLAKMALKRNGIFEDLEFSKQ